MVLHIFQGIQTFIITLCYVSLFILLNRDSKVQQRQMEFILFGYSIANIGMLIEMLAKGELAIALIGRGIEIMGMSLVMMAMVYLTAFICGIEVPLYISIAMLAAGGIFCALHFCDQRFGVFYDSVEMVATKWGAVLRTRGGFGDTLYSLVCIFFPAVACIIMIIYNIFKTANIFRKKDYVRIAFAYIILLVIYLLGSFGLFDEIFDPSIAVGTLYFCVLVFSKWKYQGVDIIQVAAQTALDSIAGGVITLNQYQEVSYYNESAKKIIPEIAYCLGLPIERMNIEFAEFEDGIEAEMAINGRRYYVRCSAINDELGNVQGYALLFNDMTDIFNLMEVIKDEQRRADEASHVKTMFIANISHEIRTPMNAITGLSDLIIEESRGRKVYDMAVTIKKAANSLLTLVNNVLDVSKLESGKMTLQESNYSLETMITDIVKVMEISAMQQGIQFKCNLDENLPCLLYGDELKIRQCLINLINNGLKFTDKGYVQLDVSGIVREDRIALTFMVNDTGCGIKSEDLDRIFNQFEQVDKVMNKNKEGSGLGLAITKQLVELMGGVIDVSSVYGEGTTFTIRLSQGIANDTKILEIKEKVLDIESDLHMFEATDVKLLIVDDNKVNLMVAKGLMDMYKLQIDTAESGEQAVEMVKKKQYDIVMMDHMMPGMDGVEAMGIINDYYASQDFKTYAIALTANAYGEMREMFLRHGFEDFVSKPIEKKKLHQVLLKAITDERREFTDAILQPVAYSEDDLAELFMDGIDVRSAFDLHGCTQAEYLELLDLYYNEGLGKIESIKESYEKKDWLNYSILTHGLKSSSANIGANILSENAKAHEMASKDLENVDVAFIDENFKKLIDQYEYILAEAKRVLDKMNNAEDSEKIEGIEISQVISELNEALELSEDFQSKEAAEVIDRILKYQLDKEIEDAVREIRMKFKLYDDDGAEELMGELISKLSN